MSDRTHWSGSRMFRAGSASTVGVRSGSWLQRDYGTRMGFSTAENATRETRNGTRRNGYSRGKSTGSRRRQHSSAQAGRPVDTGGGTTPRRIRFVRRIVTGLVVAAAAVVAGEITFQSLLAPNVAINTIHLTGDSVLSEGELIDIADLGGTVLYFHVDSSAIEQRLEAVAEVKRASVTTQFPDTLYIDLTARTPLAVTSLSVDGITRPALIDSEGVVFRTGLRSSEQDLPVISGLQLERFEPGDVLPQELKPLFEDLQHLRNEEPDLFAAISEIRIVRSGARYETVLYPVSRGVPVRLPARARVAQYESAFQAIDILSRREDPDEVEEIDLRSGDLVYTMGSEG